MNHEAAEVTPPLVGHGSAELDALVARTAGPQWWRKAFHAFNATLGAALLAVLDVPRGAALGALVALLAIALAIDIVRLRSLRANQLFFKAFGRLASPREARGIASSTWYVTGILLVVALFPLDVAVSAILVMGLGDPAAALVGRTFGRRAFLGGTLEGTLAFFIVCAVIIGVRHAWPAGLVAGAAAALAERRAWPLDDNLVVPVVCAAVIQSMTWIA
jgi:dolichol kinase